MRRTCWSLLALALLLPSCFHAAHAPSTAQPSLPPNVNLPGTPPSTTPTPAAPTPSPVLVSPPVITPTPGAAVQPATAPRLSKPVPALQPDAAPQILAISVSETTVKPGDRVSGSVITSSNVASVQARIGGYAVSLLKVGVGRFALTYTVGPLPWFVHGTFTMYVIANNARGAAVERAIPLHVR